MRKVFFVIGIVLLGVGSSEAQQGEDRAIAVTVQGTPGYEVDSYVMELVLNLNADLVRRDLVGIFHVYVRSHFGSSVFDHGGTFCLEAKKEVSRDSFEAEVMLPFFDIQGLAKGGRTIEFNYVTDEVCPPMNWKTLMKGPAIKVDISGRDGGPADPKFIDKVIDLNARLFRQDLVDDYRVTRRTSSKRSGFAFCLAPRANPPTKLFETIFEMYKKIGKAPKNTAYQLSSVDDCGDEAQRPIRREDRSTYYGDYSLSFNGL
jgi:hypothetical protein